MISSFVDRSLVDVIDSIIGPDWKALESHPRPAPRPRTVARSRFVTGGGDYDDMRVRPPSNVAIDDKRRQRIEAFRCSSLSLTLQSGELVVQAKQRDDEGAWSDDPETLQPELWQFERFIIQRSPPVLAWLVGKGVWRYFANPMIRLPDAERGQQRPAESHSGMAGRPSSKHLAIAEMERRATAGEMCPKIGDEAKVLHAWLKAAHPHENPGTTRTLENSIRSRYLELKALCMK
jgi:hypothetical protein